MLRYTLVCDGPGDRVLLRPIDWLLAAHGTQRALGTWADLRLAPGPAVSLAGRIRRAVELYPCRLLVVHRDAERHDPAARRREIAEAAAEASIGTLLVAVVPVRMTEAWLLHDEQAIRRAAGNPRGTITLDLPGPGEVERIDAKQRFRDALRAASELSGRKLRRFDAAAAVHRVAELSGDYGALRGLPAFDAFERDLAVVLQQYNPGRP